MGTVSSNRGIASRALDGTYWPQSPPLEWSESSQPSLYVGHPYRDLFGNERYRYIWSDSWLRVKDLQQLVTALATEMSRYSLYMLWVPVRELYRSQTPKFLTRSAGLFSWTSLISTISPFAFLTFRSFRVKYQNRDLATIWSGANIVIRYSGGFSLVLSGNRRPMILYWRNCWGQTYR